MEDLDRAHEFATKVDEPGVWSELAHAYLEHAQVGGLGGAGWLEAGRRRQPPGGGAFVLDEQSAPRSCASRASLNVFPAPLPASAPAQVGEAIACYLRAADTSKYNEVIAKANEVGGWLPGILQPARAALSSPRMSCGGRAGGTQGERPGTLCSAAPLLQRAPPPPLPPPAAGRPARRPGQVPADGAQEGQGPQGEEAALCGTSAALGGAGRLSGSCHAVDLACCHGCQGGGTAPQERLPGSFPPHLPHPMLPHSRSQVDTELVYAYAKQKDLGPLEEFISGTHLANLQSVGDRCAAGAGAGAGLSRRWPGRRSAGLRTRRLGLVLRQAPHGSAARRRPA